jgi:glycosyltransferase involved in cell wall biosynthesis
VALEQFAPAPPPPAPPVQALFLGRLIETKGLRELHQAALRLREAAPQVRVVVAGEPDPHNPACIDAATLDRWRTDGALTFLGRRDDVASLLRSTHLVVLPSYREGVPKALLEAAAAGRPIVATDVPGNREVVAHGENGLLVPVHDADALAAAVAELARDEHRRAAMGRASRRRAERHFSDRAVVAATLDIYASAEVA